ncbi:LOW QUALITY PROTEIN: hypothetical protein Cgig2_011910 [Carnegiea gigantea]|uniref:Uncharacterized protein n=1 Tax=Carnegiea gigantea TaxID=171969 RepID=A0A9Q1K3J2_9CARY|nr:LOW QUALITY PROTEIN: hypothetical protein Cgig2_011910 [Carnegiea gigantea]
MRGKGVIAFTPLSTPAERLKAVEIDLEKDRTRTKQSKVNASWMKTAKKLIKIFGNWVIDNNQPFTVVDSIYTSPLLNIIREVGQDVRALKHQQAPNDAEIRARVQRVTIRLESNIETQITAMNKLFLYSQGQDTFGAPLAQRAVKNTMPDQQSEGTHNSGSGSDLSPPSTADGSGDGGNRGNRGANNIVTSQSSRPSSRDINPIMSDHNSRRGEEHEEEIIAHTYYRLRKAKDKPSKAPPNYDNQMNNKCLPLLQRLLTVINHVILTVMMVVHITMDIIKQKQIGVHHLTNLTTLSLVMNHILLNPIQAPKIMTIFRFSTTRLLLMSTIIITAPQFMVEIRVQVVNLG